MIGSIDPMPGTNQIAVVGLVVFLAVLSAAYVAVFVVGRECSTHTAVDVKADGTVVEVKTTTCTHPFFGE